MTFSTLLLTLFPEMFPGPLACSLAGKALERGVWSLETMQIRDFALSKHGAVDDASYGGGTGLVMKPDVAGQAIEAAQIRLPGARLVYPTPRGETFSQRLAAEFIRKPLIVLCGRYEGVDQRVLDHYGAQEVSLGDFVLSGGEIAALAMLDACVRLLPGVIGNEEALAEESFRECSEYAGLLEYPHYTRPPLWKGVSVPEALLCGNHARIRAWRLEQARRATQARRPDLWNRYENKAPAGIKAEKE